MQNQSVGYTPFVPGKTYVFPRPGDMLSSNTYLQEYSAFREKFFTEGKSGLFLGAFPGMEVYSAVYVPHLQVIIPVYGSEIRHHWMTLVCPRSVRLPEYVRPPQPHQGKMHA